MRHRRGKKKTPSRPESCTGWHAHSVINRQSICKAKKLRHRSDLKAKIIQRKVVRKHLVAGSSRVPLPADGNSQLFERVNPTRAIYKPVYFRKGTSSLLQQPLLGGLGGSRRALGGLQGDAPGQAAAAPVRGAGRRQRLPAGRARG